MENHLRGVRAGVLAAVLMGVAVWMTGCGSMSSEAFRISGTVEAPATQVTQAERQGASMLARIFTLGSPAEALGAIQRRRVPNATVEVRLVGGQETLATTTTDSEGRFEIVLNDIPAGTLLMVIVQAQGPHGRIQLRAVLRVHADQTDTLVINEATTVGAAAAETALHHGADEETAEDAANEVTQEQEATEDDQDPDSIPDLSDTDEARENVNDQANGHLVGNLDTKLQNSMGPNPERRHILQAIMASQVYARVVLGLEPPIRLSRAQVLALAQLIQTGKKFTADELVIALAAAGVQSNGNPVSADDVAAALAALKARPRLSTVLSDVTVSEMPVLVALLLAEQVNDESVPFHISTQEELNLYVNALTGSVVPGPHVQGSGMGE